MNKKVYNMKKDEKLRKLLELYFEGGTDSAQEEELRRRFLSGKVPEDLEKYRPLFGYIAQEMADAAMTGAGGGRTSVRMGRRRIMSIAAAAVGAAAVISAVGVFAISGRFGGGPGFELTVGGRRVADEALAIEIADRGLSRLQGLQAALDQSLGTLQMRMEKTDSTVHVLEESILSKFKLQ